MRYCFILLIILLTCCSSPELPPGMELEPLTLNKETFIGHTHVHVYFDSVKGNVESVNLDYFAVLSDPENGIDTLLKVPGNGNRQIYDEQMRLIEWLNVYEDEVYSVGKLRHDDRGNFVAYEIENKVDKKQEVLKFEYDPEWNVLRKKTTASETVLYNYDSLGRLKNSGGNFTGKTEWRKSFYQYEGRTTRLRQQTFIYADGSSGKTLYYYDSAGNNTARASQGSDSVVYLHDYAGQVIFKKSFRTSYPQTFRYEYEYDPAGNWIKKTEYTSGLKTVIQMRTIRYR